jgi:hypothetical protein
MLSGMLRLRMPSSNNIETMFVQQAVPTTTLLSAVMTATAMTTRAGMASMPTTVVTTRAMTIRAMTAIPTRAATWLGLQL